MKRRYEIFKTSSGPSTGKAPLNHTIFSPSQIGETAPLSMHVVLRIAKEAHAIFSVVLSRYFAFHKRYFCYALVSYFCRLGSPLALFQCSAILQPKSLEVKSAKKLPVDNKSQLQ
jgi:hypothetical protein